jgi:hypothetical protein
MAQTKLEIDKRVDFAADILLRHHRRTDQLEAVCKEFNIEWRQATRYLTQARERILEATKKSRDEHLAEAVDFYESITKNPLCQTKDRIAARKQLDRAVGIGVATQSVLPVIVDPLSTLDLAAVAAEARKERQVRAEKARPVPPELPGGVPKEAVADVLGE